MGEPVENPGGADSPESEGFHELLRRAQDGDRAAMDRLLDLLRPYIEQLAQPFADPARPAESTSDLLQESCLRIWHKLPTFAGGKNDEETFAMFRAWVGKMVRNLGLNARRDNSRLRRSPPKKILPLGPTGQGDTTTGGSGVEAQAPCGTPSEYARADERALRIQKALDDFPDATAAAIVRMRFFDGMSLTDISRALDLEYEKVKDRYRHTIRHLERDLGGLI